MKTRSAAVFKRLSGKRLPIPFFAALVVALASTAAGQVSNWPSEVPPQPLPSRPVNFPPYELRTLSNGMQVIVVMRHEQPEVSMRLLVRAGAAYDPPGKSGVAMLVAQLLNQGTRSRSAQEIAETIDSIGGALGTGTMSRRRTCW
jgi:predicted Zn-dependent peptidase